MKQRKLSGIKTLQIVGKEWFDRINGNSYCAARATINFELKSQREIIAPFQYGYGSFYRQAIFEIIAKETGEDYNDVTGYFFGKSNYTATLHKGCKKREVIAWGQE